MSDFLFYSPLQCKIALYTICPNLCENLTVTSIFKSSPILIVVSSNLNMDVITLYLQLLQNASAYGPGEQLGMPLTVINGMSLCNISGLESSCPLPIQCWTKYTSANHLIKGRCIWSFSELALLLNGAGRSCVSWWFAPVLNLYVDLCLSPVGVQMVWIYTVQTVYNWTGATICLQPGSI